VRQLTGWTDACADVAVDPREAWGLVCDATTRSAEMPTIIHYARFELPFLRDLHAYATSGGESDEAFPLDTICLHAIAQRLFPELPRRNLRALAGHLGHSPELVRRAAGHVEATAFIWRALLPALEERGVRTWHDLKAWLEEEPAPPSRAKGAKRSYPLATDRRRALPDVPGVYRFLRPNGDVVYVGKAASLKKRVASHFTGGARKTERALEMLSQVHDVDVTITATALEAALLETDEIKRIDPPYNVQLRAGDRHAWFASRDWQSAESAPDDDHRVGPLPSRAALSGIAAVRQLLDGAPTTDERRAAAVGVPMRFGPDDATFADGWRAFVRDELNGEGSAMRSARTRILAAARRIVLREREEEEEEDAPIGWDVDTVLRYLERTVFQEGLLVRRARMLTLLSDSVVMFREPKSTVTRRLSISGGEVAASDMLLEAPSMQGRSPTRFARQASFDAGRYDRLRILATELRRVVDQGGEVSVRVGAHQTKQNGVSDVPE
jgi:DNA polymerase-3 subunit epsilon